MKKLIFVGLAALIFAFSGCSSQKTDEADNKAPVQKKQAVVEKKAVDPLLTKEGLEKKLAGFGITAYPGAEFEKVKSSADGYKISYKLSDMTQAGNDDVNKHLEKEYKKLVDNGWKRFDELHAIFSKNKQMIQFTHLYKPELKMHKIVTTYGLLE
ncbi:MAG: hypothetical protein JRC91_05480 [Deltaproteobacteria bacterium]|nr:hypothetical protein [Deltaproteobacteria bacterium]